VSQILELTPYQVSELMRFVRAEKTELEYVPLSKEQEDAVKKTMAKFRKAYTDRGMRVPGES